MHLGLKLATEIIKPWEELNTELIKPNTIDSNLSSLTRIAGQLSVTISHFPESANRKDIRTNKKSQAFNTIVDVADAYKHNVIVNERSNSLSISSQFEGKDNQTFRFIRNAISINHSSYGKSDFLQTSKEAIAFIIGKLGLNIFWNPEINEGSEVFQDEVFLNLLFEHQITWSGLRIEFFKRNENGDLLHYDPPQLKFRMQSPKSIIANSELEYLIQLLNHSIDFNSSITTGEQLFINDSKSFASDIIITYRKKDKTIVHLLKEHEIHECNLSEWEKILHETRVERIILVSKAEFPKEIRQQVSQSMKSICLVTLKALDADNIPLNFFNKKVNHSYIKLTSLDSFHLEVLKEDEDKFQSLVGKPLNEMGNIFSLDKQSLISFKTLCLSFVKHKNNENEGKQEIKVKPRDRRNIFCKINEEFIKIGLEAKFGWHAENNELRMSILSFKESKLGVSVWNLETFCKMNDELVEIKMPCTKYGVTSAIGFL